MSDQQDPRRIRVVFEPNRFGAEHLIEVYEQLKPVESRSIEAQPSAKRVERKRAVAQEAQQ
jgi:hypothetical protein